MAHKAADVRGFKIVVRQAGAFAPGSANAKRHKPGGDEKLFGNKGARVADHLAALLLPSFQGGVHYLRGYLGEFIEYR